MASKGNSGGGNRDWSPQDDYPIYLNTENVSNDKQSELYEVYDVEPSIERDMINENLEKLSNEKERLHQEIEDLMDRASLEENLDKLQEYNTDEVELRRITENIDRAEQLQQQQLKTLERMSSIIDEISSGVTPSRERQLRQQLDYQNSLREEYIGELSQLNYEYW